MKASTIVATVVAIAVGVYSGPHLLIPLALTGLIWWAARKRFPVAHPATWPPPRCRPVTCCGSRSA